MLEQCQSIPKPLFYNFNPENEPYSWQLFQVAFDQIGFMTTTTISRQRKKQEPAVMAELDQRLRRLNSIDAGDEQ